MNQLRRLAIELRPPALDDFGLAAALERLTESIASVHGDLQIELHCELDRRLSADSETALYRMVQESLTNVIKHAEATHVSVVIRATSASVLALVEDDGQGFAPGAGRHDSFGLVAMRERLALAGGTLMIESEPGQGTLVRTEVPL